MAKIGNSQRDGFTSKFGVIAAAAGSAIGLGNIWRFPYVLGENGGGAFFLLYLFFIFAIGIPVMLSELVIGRRGQKNAIGSFKALAPRSGWFGIGIMGVGAAYMILSFYSAVAGWTLEYTWQAISNGFAGKSPDELTQMYDSFTAGSVRPVVWMLVFLFFTAIIVISGIEKGIEKYTKILMPLLLVLIVILDIRAVTLKGAGAGLEFLFKPDFSKITGKVVIEALGQAFFSLSLGMGTIITYGSYIQKREGLASTAVSVSLADTMIAVLAGVAIFPAVFAFGIQPDEGPGLVFVTLPNIFQQMPGGYLFGVMFFLLLVIAALTSSISLLEVVVAYFSEELHMSRKKATGVAIAGIAVLGVLCSLSSGALSEFTIFGRTIFGNLDYFSSNFLLPLGGLLIILFLGWVYSKKKVKEELEAHGKKASFFSIYIFIIKFIAPLGIGLVFLHGIGLIKF